METAVTNATHRKNAREALTGKWGTMALIIFVSFLFRMLVGSLVGSVVSFPSGSSGNNFINFLLNNLVFFAVTYGTYYCALRVSRGQDVEVSLLMKVFQGTLYVPLLLINIIQYAVNFLVNLIVLLPVFISYGTAIYFGLMFNTLSVQEFQNRMAGDFVLAMLLLVFSVLTMFIGVFVSGVFQFAVWIKMDDQEKGIGDILTYALALMKGRFGRYLMLQLSFIGWYLIGGLAFGVGLFWVIPYHDVAVASFYNTAREENGGAIQPV